MARTHTFKGSAMGCGYAAFIEDGQLVITEDWGREGGVLYKGPYHHAQIIMSRLRSQVPKLANSIDKYYFEKVSEQKVSNAPAKEETITYHFKDSRDIYGYGYFGYIENGQLVLCNEQPREGGVYFRGSYEEAVAQKHMYSLKFNDKVLYDDIEKYFNKHGAEPKVPTKEVTSSPAGVLWKVKLYMKTELMIHYVLVRGMSESSVINKLFPKVPEVLTLQTHDARVIAIRSDMISAAEFMPED